MTMDDTAAPAPQKSVAEATADLAKSREREARAQMALKDATDELAMAKRAVAADYRAFNAAVEAMRPKRPRKAKAEGGAA